jgi:serine/threonine protein kinase
MAAPTDLDRCASCFEPLGIPIAPDQTVCPRCEAEVAAKGDRTHDLALGALLAQGRYTVGRVLGRGAFGVTYLAWDPRLRRRVAVKEFLPIDVAGRSTDRRSVQAHSHGQESIFEYARDRFRQEARLVSQLDHPNIIRILDFFPDNGTEYMVMEYFPGETLGEYMHRNGRIPESAAIGLMSIVLEALEEVHRERDGVQHIHRDLKPSNVYLAAIGATVVPKLLDFGAARTAVGEKTRNLTQVLTPGYAPFEQYHAKGKQGAWTDVYACAATLYHMLTGRKPTAAPDRYESDSLESPRDLVPELSPAVSRAVMDGLALDRQRRPQSAAAFRKVLNDEVKDDAAKRPTAVAAPPEVSDPETGAPTEALPRRGVLQRLTDVFTGKRPL